VKKLEDLGAKTEPAVTKSAPVTEEMQVTEIV
jgi:hypothetical protein